MIALAAPLLSVAQTEKVLYSFGSLGASDAILPMSAPVEDAQGNLYGNTETGGGNGCGGGGCGAVYRLAPPTRKGGSWTESVIYNFGSSANDGVFPGQSASHVFDASGNLYGTTIAGGTGCSSASPAGCGTVFELSPPSGPGGSWSETTLYRFLGIDGGHRDGFDPQAGLVLDGDGNLYGTTEYGGSGSACTGIPGACGTAFKLVKPATLGGKWTEKIIHNFGSWENDGANPVAPLIFVKSGELFGTTLFGGRFSCSAGGLSSGCGSVFELVPPATAGGRWIQRSVAIGPQSKGAFVSAGLVRGSNGRLYGMTSEGGSGGCEDSLQNPIGCGVIFEVITPINMPHFGREPVYSFTGMSDGSFPQSKLPTDPAGNLYGVAPGGGLTSCSSSQFGEGCGVLFQLTPPASSTGSWSENTLYEFSGGEDGALPWSVIRNRAGGFFGVTVNGGFACNANGCGTVFEFTP